MQPESTDSRYLDYASKTPPALSKRLATASVVVGVISFLLPPLGISAIQLAIVAQREAKQHSQRVLRRAEVGLVCGVISLVGWLITVLAFASLCLDFGR